MKLFELPPIIRRGIDLSGGVFSVINRLSGDWPSRKAAWMSLMPSDIGRADGLCSDMDRLSARNKQWTGSKSGTSEMDPAICELVYSAYRPNTVLDPFAGGPPRGYVASHMGIHYTGYEIRAEQIEVNMSMAHTLPTPIKYINACSSKGLEGMYDMVFSCPPYFDLEQYGGGPEDLSLMSKSEFDRMYRRILSMCYEHLNVGGIMAMVVGNHVRKGKYHDLEHLTKFIYYDLGIEMIGDCIIVDPIGSKAMSAGTLFRANGRVTRHHQYLLIGRK